MKKRYSKKHKRIMKLLCAIGLLSPFILFPIEINTSTKPSITYPSFNKTDKETAISWLQERNIYICTDAAKQAVSNDDFETLHYLLAAGWDINDSDNCRSCLWHAVNQEKEAMCRFLLEHGADANKYKPLQQALKTGNLEIVRLLLKHKADPKSFLTPLHLALIEGRENEVRSICGKQEDAAKQDPYQYQFAYLGWTESPKVARMLIQAGANPKQKEQTTPLVFATKRQNKKMLKLLLEHGADPNEPNIMGKTTMHYAATFSSADIVDFLVAAGASVNVSNRIGLTPLHFAVKRGDPAIVKALLKAGASVNAEDEQGLRPIHPAAAAGNAEIVELLLAADALFRLPDNKGNLPLHLACRNGHAAAVALLLKAGADVNAANTRGQTPLLLAAQADSPETMELLLEAGAKTDAIDAKKKGFIDYALAAREGKILPLIFNKKLISADSHAPGDPDTSLLKYAAQKDYPHLAEALLANGADIGVQDSDQDTPLHSASFRNHTATMAVLLKNGANIHATNRKGNTPLHYAVRRENVQATELLLKHQANPQTANKQGETPLTLAAERGNMEIFHKMVDEKADLPANLIKLLMETLAYTGNPELADFLKKKGHFKINKETLLRATERGQTGYCSYLLEQGMNVNTTNDAKESLLILATKSYQLPLVKLLLSKGADVHHRDAKGKQALDYASSYNIREAILNQFNESVKEYFHTVANLHPHRVRKLCKNLPDVNITDKSGNTAAHIAAEKDRPHVLQVLHEVGVDLNRQNNTSKDSPLIKAAWSNSKYAAEKLCKLGVDVNLVNRDLNTALHLCCSENRRYIAQLLIRHKAELNLKNKRGLTPLQLATNHKHTDICNLLTSANGIDVNISNNQHDTPLHSAARNGMNQHILSLCHCGALAHIPNDKGELAVDMIQHSETREKVQNHVRKIPLHEFMYSAWHGEVKNMKKLVKEHPEIATQQDSLGFSALHLAARNGNMDAVQYLCRSKEQIDNKNKNGESPLDLAKRGNHAEVVAYLENFDPETAIFDDEDKKKKKKGKKRRK